MGKTQTYTVYHGGQHHGLGRWSGPHATQREAEQSAAQCRKIVGGDPVIVDDHTGRRIEREVFDRF